MDMIERVTAAILESWRDGAHPCFENACSPGACYCAAKSARAAIEAMREPNKAMFKAPFGHGGMGFIGCEERLLFVWQAMIDKALEGEDK